MSGPGWPSGTCLIVFLLLISLFISGCCCCCITGGGTTNGAEVFQGIEKGTEIGIGGQRWWRDCGRCRR